jgi:hypothetical protein
VLDKLTAAWARQHHQDGGVARLGASLVPLHPLPRLPQEIRSVVYTTNSTTGIQVTRTRPLGSPSWLCAPPRRPENVARFPTGSTSSPTISSR